MLHAAAQMGLGPEATAMSEASEAELSGEEAGRAVAAPATSRVNLQLAALVDQVARNIGPVPVGGFIPYRVR